jgi:hypothetical protein
MRTVTSGPGGRAMIGRLRGARAARAATVGTRLAHGAYMAWKSAQIECDLALRAWHAAGPGRTAAAHVTYRAALDREEAAARDLEELSRLATRISSLRAARA